MDLNRGNNNYNLIVLQRIMTEDKAINILMVDDDPEDIFAMKRALTRSKLKVNFDSVQSGDEFFNRKGDVPEMILLDINIPKTNGHDILKRIRELHDYSKTKVIMLTTSTLDADKRRSVRNGATGFYTKPSSSQEMDSLIDELCALS